MRRRCCLLEVNYKKAHWLVLALLQSEMDLFVPAIFTFVSRHLEDRQGSTEGLGCCYNMTVQNNKNIKEGGRGGIQICSVISVKEDNGNNHKPFMLNHKTKTRQIKH